MRLVVNKPGKSFFKIAAVLLAALCIGQEARANVFASNIKLNGGLSSITNSNASPVIVSYILNEPATLGTTINILSGGTTVDSINVVAGNPGTLKGTNAVVWGATNSGGSTVGGGIYSVSITAVASGYTNWTQITTDTNAANFVIWPAGIAVDCNTKSLYYGRIMVANSGPSLRTSPGQTNGIIKLNADGSYADEGQRNAGYAFAFDGILGDIPRRGRIGADDRFYFDDWSDSGVVVAVDMLMTTNQVIIDSANFTQSDNQGTWPDFDVTDVGTTNARVYLTDANFPTQGLWSWPITNNGAADPVDDGAQVVRPDNNNTLGTIMPRSAVFGLMLDENKDIFLGATLVTTGSPLPRATCVTNWPSGTNHPLYTNNILWQVGQTNDAFLGLTDMAIDSRVNPHFVACPLSQVPGGGPTTGGLLILNAATGALV